MKVFVFDLVPYAEHLEDLREDDELPWPLKKTHFKPSVAVQTYEEHLQAWEELDSLGFDGVAFNEHHTSPYGLMNSPNLLAAAAAQRTKRLKLAIYGNLLPLHDPLRMAEELSMLDCLSNGRLISGFARGIPREHEVYRVRLKDSRARFEEAWEIIRRAWTEESFSFEGRFWSYPEVSIWPRPVQQPHPPVWVPVTTSKETIEWAAAHDIPITPGALASSRGLREDITAYYARCLAQHGRRLTPGHLIIPANAYVADSKAAAVEEAGPYALYFTNVLFSHGNVTDANPLLQAGYLGSSSFDYIRPENMRAATRSRHEYRGMTMTDIERQMQDAPAGRPDEVIERIIADADHAGAGTVLVNLNRGAMPQELFLNQIRRFGKEVLPALQAHEVAPVEA